MFSYWRFITRCLIGVLSNGLLFVLVVSAQAGAILPSLGDLYERVNPAVIKIESLERKVVPSLGAGERQAQSIGSGFVISQDGYVMTAAHVVHLADSVRIKFHDGQQSEADIVSSIPSADLALLKLRNVPDNMRVAELGDSSEVRIGDPIIVIGAPQGIDHTLSVGYVSGRMRGDAFAGNLLPIEYIQTDAAINRGNSGGAMFDLNGKVIAVTSRIVSESGGSEGLGFGVNINVAKQLLLEHDGIWGGLDSVVLAGRLAKIFNLPQPAGLLVQRVANGSLAHRIGLRPSLVAARIGDRDLLVGGDIILSVDNTLVSGVPEEQPKLFETFVSALKTGKIRLTVLREGRIADLELKE